MINIEPRKAFLLLENLKLTRQFFCFTAFNQVYTAEELLSVIKGRKVTYQETIEYLTS